MDWINRFGEWVETPIHFEVSPFMIFGIVFCVVMLIKVIRSMMGREVDEIVGARRLARYLDIVQLLVTEPEEHRVSDRVVVRYLSLLLLDGVIHGFRTADDPDRVDILL